MMEYIDKISFAYERRRFLPNSHII